VITVRFGDADAVTGDGQKVKVPAKLALMQRGPVIPVVISPDQTFAAALQAASKPIPQPVTGFALVDTGATTTCIDATVAQKMGLAPSGTAKLSSVSHEGTQCLTYPVQLFFPAWNVGLQAARAMGVTIANQGIIALVGRDLLQNCVLVYNGADGSFTLAL
jgi:predicted aspartyl protease